MLLSKKEARKCGLGCQLLPEAFMFIFTRVLIIPRPVALFPLRVSNRMLLKLEFLSSNRVLYIYFNIIQPALKMYSMGCSVPPGPAMSFGMSQVPRSLRITIVHVSLLSLVWLHSSSFREKASNSWFLPLLGQLLTVSHCKRWLLNVF